VIFILFLLQKSSKFSNISKIIIFSKVFQIGASAIIPSFIELSKKSGTKYISPSVSKVLVNGEVSMYIKNCVQGAEATLL
jgi:hypothetical protein